MIPASPEGPWATIISAGHCAQARLEEEQTSQLCHISMATSEILECLYLVRLTDQLEAAMNIGCATGRLELGTLQPL